MFNDCKIFSDLEKHAFHLRYYNNMNAYVIKDLFMKSEKNSMAYNM